MAYEQEIEQYRKAKVVTADNGQIIVMLYQEAIKQLGIAISALEQEKYEYDIVNDAIAKAQKIILELTTSLDLENGGEFAQNLFNLYTWFNEQLLEGNLQKKIHPIEEVKYFLTDILEAWQTAQSQVSVSTDRNKPAFDISS